MLNNYTINFLILKNYLLNSGLIFFSNQNIKSKINFLNIKLKYSFSSFYSNFGKFGIFFLYKSNFFNFLNTPIILNSLIYEIISKNGIEFTNSFLIKDSVFINNTSNFNGGALLIQGNNINGSISFSIFSKNNAKIGGALYFSSIFSFLNIFESKFNNNNANYGGHLFLSSNDFYCNTSIFEFSTTNEFIYIFNTNISLFLFCNFYRNIGMIFSEINSISSIQFQNSCFLHQNESNLFINSSSIYILNCCINSKFYSGFVSDLLLFNIINSSCLSCEIYPPTPFPSVTVSIKMNNISISIIIFFSLIIFLAIFGIIFNRKNPIDINNQII